MNHRALSLLGVLLLSTAHGQAIGPSMDPLSGGSPLQARISLAGGVVAQPDLIYASVAGFRPLTLDLYSPAGARQGTRHPAVIWIHGGAWSGGTPRAGVAALGNGEQMLATLAARGYVVAAISYRLSGEAPFPAAIHDVKAAIRYLRTHAAQLQIDPDRIAVWGESAGGHLAALAGTSCEVKALDGIANPGPSSCVQAVIDFYGPTDFSQLDAQALPGGMQHATPDSPESRFLGCNLASCAASTLQLVNPISHISSKTPPFLILHGGADPAVSPRQSEWLFEALRAKGIKARLNIIPGVGHVFMGATPAQATEIITEVQQFLDQTLQPAKP